MDSSAEMLHITNREQAENVITNLRVDLVLNIYQWNSEFYEVCKTLILGKSLFKSELYVGLKDIENLLLETLSEPLFSKNASLSLESLRGMMKELKAQLIKKNDWVYGERDPKTFNKILGEMSKNFKPDTKKTVEHSTNRLNIRFLK